MTNDDKAQFYASVMAGTIDVEAAIEAAPTADRATLVMLAQAAAQAAMFALFPLDESTTEIETIDDPEWDADDTAIADLWSEQPRDTDGTWTVEGSSGMGLHEGKHVASIRVRSNMRASLKSAVTSAIHKAGLRAALEAHPLGEIAIVKQPKAWKGGQLLETSSSGVYDRNDNAIQIKGTRQEGSWGKPFVAGEMTTPSRERSCTRLGTIYSTKTRR